MTADAMIAQAEHWLGTGEPNDIQTWYHDRDGDDYSGNFPWCDAAITRWAVDSGEYDAVCHGTDYAYTVAHAQRFADAGQWTTGTSGIQRGDIVFFDWSLPAPGQGRISQIDHVGLVTDVQGPYVYTIEGNTLDTCARRVRTANSIVGYGRPAYTDAPAPAAPSAPPAAPEAPAWPGEYLTVQRTMLHDDNVRTWQQRMADRGWPIEVDGWYGEQSAGVCRGFQQDSTANGWPLKADGVVGPKTWRASWDRPVS